MINLTISFLLQSLTHGEKGLSAFRLNCYEYRKLIKKISDFTRIGTCLPSYRFGCPLFWKNHSIRRITLWF